MIFSSVTSKLTPLFFNAGSSPFFYHRWGNPTNRVVEEHVAKLEGGYGSFLASSGMAAISTALLTFLKAGDHVVAPSSDIAIHSGTKYLGGHADILCGTLTASTKEIFEKLRQKISDFGRNFVADGRIFIREGNKNVGSEDEGTQ